MNAAAQEFEPSMIHHATGDATDSTDAPRIDEAATSTGEKSSVCCEKTFNDLAKRLDGVESSRSDDDQWSCSDYDQESDTSENKLSTVSPDALSATHSQPCTSTKVASDKTELQSLSKPDPRPHLNVVFIGHVDAGKSTTCGNILVLAGQVDVRMLEKYERDAKEKQRESWYYAFIMDTHDEERQRGKTVEVGRATLDRPDIRFTILDAPGHRGFVPNMISGAAQADVAVLIVSARKGEFETGFVKGGQTCEHILLAKTLGVSSLIVAVNKMDELLCDWEQARYEEIQKRLLPYLKKCGFNPATQIRFVPISGLRGHNLDKHVLQFPDVKSKAKWYTADRPTLFQLLDTCEIPDRDRNVPFRIPLLEGYRDQSVVAMGKIECGTIYANESAVMMPHNVQVKIASILINNTPVSHAYPGENVVMRVLGCNESAITRGSVLCPATAPCPAVTKFKAQLVIVELLEHRPIITLSYACIIHAHTAIDECQFTALYEVIDRHTKKKKTNPQFVRSNCMLTCELMLGTSMCIEAFDKCPQLGRFTLRDEGKTLGFGRVLEVVETAAML